MANRRNTRFLPVPNLVFNGPGPDARSSYLGRPVTRFEWTFVEHQKKIDIDAAILGAHGIVDPERMFSKGPEEGFCPPLLEGRPIPKGPARVEALDAIANWRPTGEHFESEDGMDDAYVWARRGTNGILTIKRQLKVHQNENTGRTAFDIKYSPGELGADRPTQQEELGRELARGFKRRAEDDLLVNGYGSDANETMAVPSEAESAVTAALDENGIILDLATYQALNPPPPRQWRVHDTVSKSKGAMREKRRLAAEEAEAAKVTQSSSKIARRENQPKHVRRKVELSEDGTICGGQQPHFRRVEQERPVAPPSAPTEVRSEATSSARRKIQPSVPSARLRLKHTIASWTQLQAQDAYPSKRASNTAMSDTHRQDSVASESGKYSDSLSDISEDDTVISESDGTHSLAAARAARSERLRQAALNAVTSITGAAGRSADSELDKDVRPLELDLSAKQATTGAQQSDGPDYIAAGSPEEATVSSPLARIYARKNVAVKSAVRAGQRPFELPEGVPAGSNPLLDEIVRQSQVDYSAAAKRLELETPNSHASSQERIGVHTAPDRVMTKPQASSEDTTSLHPADRFTLPKPQATPVPNLFNSLAGRVSTFSRMTSSPISQEEAGPSSPIDPLPS